MLRLIFTFLIVISAFCLQAFSQAREVPKGWKEVKDCSFSMLMPKKLKKRNDIKPIDSCIGVYEGGGMRLSFDYGMYTGKPEEDPRIKKEELLIDGKKALLTPGNYGASVYIVTYEGDKGNPTTALGMGFSAKRTDGGQIARQIFQSIRFDR